MSPWLAALGPAMVLAGVLFFWRREWRSARRLGQRCDSLQQVLDDALGLLQAIPTAVISTDSHGIVRYLNPGAEALTGQRYAQAAGKSIRDLLKLRQGGAMVDAVQQVTDCLRPPVQGAATSLQSPVPVDRPGGAVAMLEAQLRRPDGSQVHIEQRCAALALPANTALLAGVVMTLHDMSARRETEERLEFIAHHDGLTGLANRVQFQLRLEHGIAYARRHRTLMAVVLVDIDRFRIINDTLGREAGDQVLVEFSARLQACVRQVDTVARQGGDEFIVLLTEMRTPQDAERVAGQLLNAVSAPFSIGGKILSIAASVGMAIYPDDDDDSEALIEKADLAMYAAKHRGVGAWLRYVPSMQAKAYSRMILETALRKALAHDEFILAYQPKLDLASGRICGVKALMRWKHPELGLVMPLDFMPVLEHCSLAVPVGAWVLEAALGQVRRWREAGQALTVSVSISARQFNQKDVAENFGALLEQAGVPGSALELELSESLLVDKSKHCEAVLRQFRQLGVRICIGDIGTGYASLSYLKRYPIDAVRIDKSFIDGLRDRDGPHSGKGGAMVRGIISMAHAQQMKVIAGGVETEEQLAGLSGMECDEAFGFWLSRAVAPAEIDALLKSRLHQAQSRAQAGMPGRTARQTQSTRHAVGLREP
jgi:diguanylate cyclase (GGDEF)-like protein